ncbi:MAG: biosynthetic-type acetolactate synthase large subunit [Acidobacteria bacterium]|nr:MAG: biosynthetic-type acetolactate synthase large subunit [Acidobacteriota bacterium]
MSMKGARIFVECLLRENVEVIFGIPGGVVLSIYDELYDAPIKHVLMRHEQAAAHAADGYARASGKVGVCLATSGPGATNLVTGIVTAHMDSVPLVVFTGNVPTHLIGNDAFQEADIVGITRPCTKHNYLVRRTEDLPRVIKEAFYIASTGRPGPVLVDMPKDLLLSEAEFSYPETVSLRGYRPVVEADRRQIEAAARALMEAKRPVVYAGGGVITSGASAELLEVAELAEIPVTTTLMGIGGFPTVHRLSLGMLGMHGTWYANTAISHADLLFAIGVRFDDRVTGKLEEFAAEAKKIHVEIDPSEINKNVPVDLPILGDAKAVLQQLKPYLIEMRAKMPPEWHDERRAWITQIERWKREHPLCYDDDEEVIKPQRLIEEISRATRGDAIISVDVGQHQMWAAQFYRFKRPRTWLSSSGLGTMGFGFPAAIGAQMARPDQLVVAIVGDGGFQMTMQELATVAEHRLPVKVVIVNNAYLGMVRQWQQIFFNGRYSAVDLSLSPDFARLAEAFGIVGYRVTRPAALADTIEEAFSIPGPVVLDVHVAPEENVYPMVPPGASIKEMIEGQYKSPKTFQLT